MRRDIVLQMADGEEKSIPFVANGATSLRFRMVFGKELMDSISNIINKVGIDKLAGMMKSAEAAQAAMAAMRGGATASEEKKEEE